MGVGSATCRATGVGCLSSISFSFTSSSSSSLEVSSNPVMLYSSPPQLCSSCSSSSSSKTFGITKWAEGNERWDPLGVDPAFTGVLGGKRLSKNSGERAGPNVTLLRERFLGGPPCADNGELLASRAHFEDMSEDRRLREVEAVGKGDKVSSSSGIDMRDVDMEMEEDVRERPEEGMGVTTRFSLPGDFGDIAEGI